MGSKELEKNNSFENFEASWSFFEVLKIEIIKLTKKIHKFLPVIEIRNKAGGWKCGSDHPNLGEKSAPSKIS